MLTLVCCCCISSFATYDSQSTTTEYTLSENGDIYELRDAFTKHYRIDDNAVNAVSYTMPVHYLKNNAWIDIDNSFVNTIVDGKEYYKTNDNYFDVYFAKRSTSSEMAFVFCGNRKISWSILNSNVSEAIITLDDQCQSIYSGSLLYESIFDYADLIYSVNSNEIKEDIVYSNIPSSNVIRYRFDTDGLTLSLNSDNSISISDNGVLIANMLSPYLYDSNNIISTNIEVNLENTIGNIYILEYVLPSSYLRSSVTQYPVTLDPQIKIGYLYDNIYDNYAYSGSPNTSYYSEKNMIVGNTTGGTYNSYLKFVNMPTLPSDAEAITAYLNLSYLYDYDANNISGITIKPISESQSYNLNAVTWNNRPDTDGDYAVNWLATNVEICSNFYSLRCDISNIVRLWYSSGYSYCFGLELSPTHTPPAANLNKFITCNNSVTVTNLSNYSDNDSFNYIYSKNELYPYISVGYNLSSSSVSSIPILPRGHVYLGSVAVGSNNVFKFKPEENVTEYAFYIKSNLTYATLKGTSNTFTCNITCSNGDLFDGKIINYDNLNDNGALQGHRYAFTLTDLDPDETYTVTSVGFQGTSTYLYGDFSLVYDYNYRDMTISHFMQSNDSTLNLTDGYGYRYINGGYSFHGGIDIGVSCNIYAIASGTVIGIGENTGDAGYYIAIRTNEYIPGTNKKLVYAFYHLTAKPSFTVGSSVSAGTLLGHSGGTNGTSSPYATHIHLSAFVYNSNTQSFTTNKSYTVDPIMLFDQITFNRTTIG